MNQNLTERAQQVIATARHEALSLNHAYAGTEHILLALLNSDFRESASLFSAFGVDARKFASEF